MLTYVMLLKKKNKNKEIEFWAKEKFVLDRIVLGLLFL
jgi:hypothetical protein